MPTSAENSDDDLSSLSLGGMAASIMQAPAAALARIRTHRPPRAVRHQARVAARSGGVVEAWHWPIISRTATAQAGARRRCEAGRAAAAGG